jgi:hypothetical protein
MSTRVESAPERLTARMAWALLALVLAAVGVIIALQYLRDDGSGAAEAVAPAQVEHVEGSEIASITLMPEAAKRLGIRTVAVKKSGRAFVVPYSALVYDEHGDAWVYVSTDPLEFERKAVKVVRIEGNNVLLAAGLPRGTRVAIVGVPELYGTEFEVGH